MSLRDLEPRSGKHRGLTRGSLKLSLADPRYSEFQAQVSGGKEALFLAPYSPGELELGPEHWVHDKHESACYECNKEFTVSRRRHHCRQCGRLFCHECSTKRPVLSPQSGTKAKEVRLCFLCSAIQTLDNTKISLMYKPEEASEARSILEEFVRHLAKFTGTGRSRSSSSGKGSSGSRKKSRRGSRSNQAANMDNAQRIVRAMRNFTIHEQHRQMIAETSLVQLVTLLSGDDEIILEHASAVLANLLATGQHGDAVRQSGGIIALVGLLLLRNETVQHHAAAAIRYLAEANVADSVAVGQAGPMFPMVNILLHAQSEELRMDTALALLALAKVDGNRANILIEGGLPLVLAEFAKRPSMGSRYREAMATFSAPGPEQTEALLTLLEYDDEKVQIFAATQLREVAKQRALSSDIDEASVVAIAAAVAHHLPQISSLAIETIAFAIEDDRFANLFVAVDGLHYFANITQDVSADKVRERVNAVVNSAASTPVGSRSGSTDDETMADELLRRAAGEELAGAIAYVPVAFKKEAAGDRSGTIWLRINDRWSRKKVTALVEFSPKGARLATRVRAPPTVIVSMERDVMLQMSSGGLPELAVALMCQQLEIRNIRRFVDVFSLFTFERDPYLEWLDKRAAVLAKRSRNAPTSKSLSTALNADSLPEIKDSELKLALLFIPYAFIPNSTDTTGRFVLMISGNPSIDVTVNVTPLGARVVPGALKDPDCTLTSNRDAIISMLDGQNDPSVLLMTGQIQVDDLPKLLKFSKLFNFDPTKYEEFRQKMAPVILVSQTKNAKSNRAVSVVEMRPDNTPTLPPALVEAFAFLRQSFRTTKKNDFTTPEFLGAYRFIVSDVEAPAVVVYIRESGAEVGEAADDASDSDFKFTVLASQSDMLAFMSGRIKASAVLSDGLFHVPRDERKAFLTFAKAFRLSRRSFNAFRVAVGAKAGRDTDKDTDEGSVGSDKEGAQEELEPAEPPLDVQLEEAFAYLPLSYVGVEWTGAIQYDISTPWNYTIQKSVLVDPSSSTPVQVSDGFDLDPSLVECTVWVSIEVFVSMMNGSLHPVKAYMMKKVKTDNSKGMLKVGKAFRFQRERYKVFVRNLRKARRVSVAIRPSVSMGPGSRSGSPNARSRANSRLSPMPGTLPAVGASSPMRSRPVVTDEAAA